METLSALLPLGQRSRLVASGFPSKVPMMHSFEILLLSWQSCWRSYRSSNFIRKRIQQYNTVCMTNITNSRVIIGIVIWFSWRPPEKPWAYQAGSHYWFEMSWGSCCSLAQWWTMVSPTQLCWRYHSLPLSQWCDVIVVRGFLQIFKKRSYLPLIKKS